MRSILIFVLAMLAIFWLRRKMARPGAPRKPGSESPPPGAIPERMLPCAYCGVHAPESEGVREGESFYCSAEHRRQHLDGGQ